MNINKMIFLPGLDKQIEFLLNKVDIKDKTILIAGSNTEQIGQLLKNDAKELIIAVDDQESLLRMRLNLAETGIPVRFMEYSNTDFINKKFDIIYSQASITRPDRNKIIKEFKKILSPDGILCAGEIVSLTENPPQFVKDVWQRSNLSPLIADKIESYYSEKGFTVLEVKDLSETLKNFYILSKRLLKEKSVDLSEEETSYYKKLLAQIKHESNVYLELGGSQHIGFWVLLLRKISE